MESEVFGFMINNDIQFDIANKRLIRINTLDSERAIVFGTVLLNATLTRFLECLLTRAVSGDLKVSKTIVLKEVWEDYGMTASSQLLWRTVRDLKKKLTSIGLGDDFIDSVGGTAYSLSKHAITPLYY